MGSKDASQKMQFLGAIKSGKSGGSAPKKLKTVKIELSKSPRTQNNPESPSD